MIVGVVGILLACVVGMAWACLYAINQLAEHRIKLRYLEERACMHEKHVSELYVLMIDMCDIAKGAQVQIVDAARAEMSRLKKTTGGST